MQQKPEQWRVTFGAGLFASVALHVAIAALVLFRLPPAPPQPQKEETVQVEMVPEPEKKPPEKKPEEKKPEEKPAEKPAEKASAKPAPEKKPVQAGKAPPQAFESASKQGGKEPAAATQPDDKPQDDEDKAAGTEAARKTPAQIEPQPKQDARPAETAQAAKPPELDLPQTETAKQAVNEGLAVEKTVPQTKPATGTPQRDAKPQAAAETAIVRDKAAGARPQRPPSGLKRAKELYSAEALSDPRVRQALGKLPKDRRMVQMCMVEALEQIRRARPQTVPQGLFFDPPKGSPVTGRMLTATDAAYRSGQAWYDIDFECTVNEESNAIAAFRFAVGGAVPKSQWKARRFPTD